MSIGLTKSGSNSKKVTTELKNVPEMSVLSINSTTEDVTKFLVDKLFEKSEKLVKWDGAALFGATENTLISLLGAAEGGRLFALINTLRASQTGNIINYVDYLLC